MPKKRVRPVRDRKLWVAGLGGLLLIAAPLVVFTRWAEPDEVGEGVRNSGEPGVSQVEPFDPAAPGSARLPGASSRLDGEGRLVLLARGQGMAVLQNVQSGPSSERYTGWTGVGRDVEGDPVLATDAQGVLTAFIIGIDGHLRQDREVTVDQDEAGGWRDLGGPDLVGTPAVAQDADGSLVAVARAANGTLWETRQSEPASDTWTAWRSLSLPAVTNPAIFLDSQEKLRIFAVGPDGRLSTIAQAGSGAQWNAPRNLGGTTDGSPTVAMDKQGRLRVFVLGTDGSLQHNVETGAAADTWLGWESLGGKLMGRPLAIKGHSGAVVVFALKENGALQEMYQTGRDREDWSPWVGHGGSIARLVSVAMDSKGRLVVYGIGKKGSMEQNYQLVRASGKWKGWENGLGGTFPLN
jgi:hypothetical protein